VHATGESALFLLLARSGEVRDDGVVAWSRRESERREEERRE